MEYPENPTDCHDVVGNRYEYGQTCKFMCRDSGIQEWYRLSSMKGRICLRFILSPTLKEKGK